MRTYDYLENPYIGQVFELDGAKSFYGVCIYQSDMMGGYIEILCMEDGVSSHVYPAMSQIGSRNKEIRK